MEPQSATFLAAGIGRGFPGAVEKGDSLHLAGGPGAAAAACGHSRVESDRLAAAQGVVAKGTGFDPESFRFFRECLGGAWRLSGQRLVTVRLERGSGCRFEKFFHVPQRASTVPQAFAG